MKNILLLLAVMTLAGCASTRISDVAPYGKDTFIISASNNLGHEATSELHIKAAQEAAAYCEKQGKVLQVSSANENGRQYWGGTSASVIFSCIDK